MVCLNLIFLIWKVNSMYPRTSFLSWDIPGEDTQDIQHNPRIIYLSQVKMGFPWHHSRLRLMGHSQACAQWGCPSCCWASCARAPCSQAESERGFKLQVAARALGPVVSVNKHCWASTQWCDLLLIQAWRCLIFQKIGTEEITHWVSGSG